MIGMHPYMSFFIQKMIERTTQDFGILSTGGVRSDVQQSMMYAQGRTTEGNRVTWTLDSFHQYGLAGDIVAFKDGKPSWETKYYTELIRLGKEIIEEFDLPIDHAFDVGLKSDYPHWQITKLNGKDARQVYDVRKIMI